jgi:hypothetical protein
MTPQPTQIFASVTADAPTDPAPSFSRVRSASLFDIARTTGLSKDDGLSTSNLLSKEGV